MRIIGTSGTTFFLFRNFNAKYKYPVIILHEGDYDTESMNEITTSIRKDCRYLIDFKKMAKQRAISKNTIVFNNLVANKAEYLENWEVPVSESWHSRFIS